MKRGETARLVSDSSERANGGSERGENEMMRICDDEKM